MFLYAVVTGVKGRAMTLLTVNDSPYSGTCRLTPDSSTEGTEMLTVYWLTCGEWEDGVSEYLQLVQ